ncbi:MAG: hypothetical protein KC731_25790 [Myxococcales bacterium]|nr:hypothetical protein [Myxococcales bacterium]
MVATGVTFVLLPACEVYESGWYGDGGDVPLEDWGGGGVCYDYCVHLAACGAVRLEDVSTCEAVCNEQLTTSPDTTHDACSCTLAQTCDDVVAHPCDDTPVPPQNCGGCGGEGGAGGSGAGGHGGAGGSGHAGGGGTGGNGSGGSGAGGDGGGPQPCLASCECPMGEQCIDGYCSGGEPPPPACVTNCDCPAGEICQAGQCALP